MNLIIDLIGAAIVGSLLVMMLITFHFQMFEAADRMAYTVNMIDHMDQTATRLNSVIALAGVGFTPTEAILHATPDSLVFRTYWDFQNDQIGFAPVRFCIKLANMPNPWGTAVVLLQDNVPLNDMGHLFWINELKFRYLTKTDAFTTTASQARSAEVRVSYFRPAPRPGGRPIITKLQFKCYFMNAYMRGA